MVKVRYFNGLAITAIVFILLSIIPVGIIVGISVSNSEFQVHDLVLDVNSTKVFNVNLGEKVYIIFNTEHGSKDIQLYLLTEEEYLALNDSFEDLENYSYITNRLVISIDGSKTPYLIIKNNLSETARIQLVFYGSDPTVQGVLMSFLAIFAIFASVLIIYTFGYLIYVLIIGPIVSTYSDDRDRNKVFSHVGSVQPVIYTAPAHAQSPPRTANISSSKPLTNVPAASPKKEGVQLAPEAKKEEAKEALLPTVKDISGKYIVAQTPVRPSPSPLTKKNQLAIFLKRAWYETGFGEKFLVVLAVFFFALGVVNGEWPLIVALPVLFTGIAVVTYYVNNTRQNKIALLIKGYKALYLSQLATLLKVSKTKARDDVWTIIRLGKANIAFDVLNEIVFDPDILNGGSPQQSGGTIKSSDLKQGNIYSQPIQVPNEAKIMICPFCETKNPPNSDFCVKCGASLKPAK